MKLHNLLGSILIYCHYLSFTASIKLTPKVVTTNLVHCEDANSGSKKCIGEMNNNKRTASSPAAFFNTQPKPSSISTTATATTTTTSTDASEKSSSLSFARQVIVLPVIMKMAATFLVPCTKASYSFLSMIIVYVSKTVFQVPKLARKGLHCFARMCTSIVTKTNKVICTCKRMGVSIVKNAIGTCIEFGGDAKQGLVDLMSGVLSLSKASCTYTYRSILIPSVRNSAIFTAWLNNVALSAYHYVSMVSQNTIYYITDLSLVVAEYAQYYSTLYFQVTVSIFQLTIKAICQSILNIPVWATEIINIMKAYLTSIGYETKQGIVQIYKDFIAFSDDMIDKAPFLVRYEDEGESKISLSPNAQMTLFVLSTLYASLPMWGEITGARVPKSNQQIIKSVVSSIQTRFFPPRTLFCTGALARGLQQSSNLKTSFNPTTGVGAVINFGAAALDERWINYIVSGWFMSGSMWTLFGSTNTELVKREESKIKFW